MGGDKGVFEDPMIATTLLDRLLHQAIVIKTKGANYHLGEHRYLIAPKQNYALSPSVRRPRGRPKNGIPRFRSITTADHQTA